MASVVVFTEQGGKENHERVAVCEMVISGSICAEMVSLLTQNAVDVGSIPTLGTPLPIFVTATTILITPHIIVTANNHLINFRKRLVDNSYGPEVLIPKEQYISFLKAVIIQLKYSS